MQEMLETQFRSLGWVDPLEKEMEYIPVFLPRKSQGQRSHGVAKRRTRPSDWGWVLSSGVISCFTLCRAVTASQLFFFLAHSQLALSGFPFGDVGHFPAWPIDSLDSMLLPLIWGLQWLGQPWKLLFKTAELPQAWVSQGSSGSETSCPGALILGC